jgi:hypothetical protein
MKVDKLSKRLGELRAKVSRAETELHLLQSEVSRTEERFKLASAGAHVEARAGKK